MAPGVCNIFNERNRAAAIRNTLHLFVFIFREEATSSLAIFHAHPLSMSNWNSEMLVVVEAIKLKKKKKNPWSLGKMTV